MNRKGRDLCRVPATPPGFTLIELLVVISIIALLVAILLPVLTRTKGAVNSARCLGNQRQMLTGWSAAMAENNDRIPFIIPLPGIATNNMQPRESWWGLLAEQYPQIEEPLAVLPSDTNSPYACPTIEERFGRPLYSSLYFGYSVNARWSENGYLGDNSLKSWASIPSPSDYPWFADPAVMGTGSGYTAPFLGKPTVDRHGLGFYHNMELGNAVYADGHAESITDAVLDEKDDSGVLIWLLAERERDGQAAAASSSPPMSASAN